jgi:integrase
VIPLNETALATMQTWATNFPDRQPEHFVFPSEHYGLAGNDPMPHAKTMDPTIPAGEIKTAWESAKEKTGVQCRFHDLRHTACTRLLERGASLPVVAYIMGWSASTTAKMAKRYGHIGADAQRAALDALTAPQTPKRDTTTSTAADGASHANS